MEERPGKREKKKRRMMKSRRKKSATVGMGEPKPPEGNECKKERRKTIETWRRRTIAVI